MSRILLDTQALLWSLFEPLRFPQRIADELTDPDTEILFSAASIWEIAIKAALGRPDFGFDPRDITGKALASGYRELPVFSGAASLVTKLPRHHRDPFDRLLIAQCIAEPARLFTSDSRLTRYSELVHWFEPR